MNDNAPGGSGSYSGPHSGPYSGPQSGPGGPPRPRRPRSKDRFVPRRKVCGFCAEKLPHIDYKDVGRLRRYLSERGKIEPRRKTGTCARHQRALTVALKRARHVALLPFVGPHARSVFWILDFGFWIASAVTSFSPTSEFDSLPVSEE